MERSSRDPYRSRQRTVRIGEIVPSFADRLHHFKSAGNFFQHRFDRRIPAGQRKFGAEAFRIDRELRQSRDAEQSDRVGGVNDAEYRHGIAHFRSVEEIGTFDLHRNSAAAKLVRHVPAMLVVTVQHSEVAVLRRRPPLTGGFDGVSDEARLLVLVVHDGMHRRGLGQVLLALQPRAGERLTRPASIRQLLAADLGIALDRLVRAAQDGRRGAPVVRHSHALHALRAEGPQELIEGPAGCAAKTIDGLVGIADGEDVSFISCEKPGELDLGDVRVLELVNQNEARALLRTLQHATAGGSSISTARVMMCPNVPRPSCFSRSST